MSASLGKLEILSVRGSSLRRISATANLGLLLLVNEAYRRYRSTRRYRTNPELVFIDKGGHLCFAILPPSTTSCELIDDFATRLHQSEPDGKANYSAGCWASGEDRAMLTFNKARIRTQSLHRQMYSVG